MNWNELSFWDKAKLFNKWVIVSLIANSFLIIGTILYMISNFKDIENAEIFLGFGCMLTWISFSRYIESSS